MNKLKVKDIIGILGYFRCEVKRIDSQIDTLDNFTYGKRSDGDKFVWDKRIQELTETKKWIEEKINVLERIEVEHD